MDFGKNFKSLNYAISYTDDATVLDNNQYFTIKTNYNAIHSGIGGGSKIQVMKILNTIEGYPDANNYNIRLKKNVNLENE